MQGIDNESENENRMQGIDNESDNENRMQGIDNESGNENRMHGIDNESGNENRLSEVGGETVRAIPMATLHDEYGALNIWLMPYMKSTCAIETLAAANVNQDERNILLAHQYVANGDALPAPSESESRFSVGGIDRIDVALFDAFDYVALGHIHGPQWIGRHTVRYCGSPLKYSFSECEQEKSVVIVDAREKGKLCYKKEPLPPRRDLVEIRCALSELGAQAADQDAFAHITLTDENMIIDAIGKVREVYPNTMLLDYDNLRSRAENTENTLSGEDVREKTPLELFDGFFELQNGASLNDTQRALFTDVTGGDTDEA
jgi:exonuclease SbcD